jgi:hypothetical protein
VPEVLTDATPLRAALRVVFLPLVPAIGFVLPVGLAAGLAVAGRSLAAEGALAALAACGVSPRRLAAPFLFVALAAALASGAVSLLAEPTALAALRADVPVLAESLFLGRLSPGALVSIGPSTEAYAGARGDGGWTDLLVVRRGPDGETVEIAAERASLAGRGTAALALRLDRGTIRSEHPDASIVAWFDRLEMPLDVAALAEPLERLLPAGLTAPVAAAWRPEAIADVSSRDRYLVARRWVAPLQTLLFGLLAAALALRGWPASRLAAATAGLLFLTFAGLRLAEPAAAGGTFPIAGALLLPHLPVAVAAFLALRRLYLTGPVC